MSSEPEAGAQTGGRADAETGDARATDEAAAAGAPEDGAAARATDGSAGAVADPEAGTADPEAGTAADLGDPAGGGPPPSEAERERDAYLDQLQRSRAEFANYKRRTGSELAAARDRGAEGLLGSLLGVLDNVGYLADAIVDDDETPLAKGVRLVYADLFGALEQAGLQPIPGVGSTFDPAVHEALLSEEAAEPVEEPVVVEVLRRGYRFKGRTLRPASVKVAR